MKSEYGLIFWVHVCFIILAFSSPLWLDWRLILLGAVSLALQYILLDGCMLSKLQWGKSNRGFWFHYVSKIFPAVSPKIVTSMTDIVIPATLVVVAYFLQST